MHCYAPVNAQLAEFVESVREDDRAKDGDFLLVERDGRAVGTATSLSMRAHLHGAGFACNGVAYVGTIRTERRKGGGGGGSGGGGGEKGVATVVMEHTVRRGRDRGDVLTTLMPFRASYYEHFGYGIVERQARWTIPMAVLPAGGGETNYRPFDPAMLPALKRLRQEIAQGGQCDHERTDGEWANLIGRMDEGPGTGGFVFVDIDGAANARGWVMLVTEWEDGAGVAKAWDWGTASIPDFRNLLGLLGSLKDQYAMAKITTPVDYPVNRMLRESQVPHRPVSHATPLLTVNTRMQMRVLDHKRFLEEIVWRAEVRGSVVVSVRESEGHESRFRLTVEGGRGGCAVSAETPGFVCTDKVYASIVSGDLPAADAVRFGLAEGEPGVLRWLGMGRKPFCGEYF